MKANGKRHRKTVCKTQAELADRLGVSLPTVEGYARRTNPKMPGKPGRYVLEDVEEWIVQNIRQHGGNRGPRQPVDPTSEEAMLDPSLTGTSPALERFRNARAGLAELELEVKRGQFLPLEKVHECFGRVASLLRSAGEILQRQFGPEALGILNEALTEGKALVAGLCQSDGFEGDESAV